MTISLRGLFEKRGSHLNDQTLNRLVDGELTPRAESRAAGHLIICGRCRLRFEEFRQVVESVAAWRRDLSEEARNINAKQRSSLHFADLQGVVRRFPGRRRPVKKLNMLRGPGAGWRVLATASAATVIAAALVLASRQNAPRTTPAEFLQRSVSATMVEPGIAGNEIARQRIQIRTQGASIERTVYRDLSGRRRRLLRQARERDAHLVAELAVAGIVWDDPLSPAGFRDWHDLQPHPSDELRPNGSNLLTLTTTLSGGIVRSESLTVRASTFHPVERTVQFANRSTVDIAELDYSIVGIGAVDASYFDPSSSHLSSPAPAAPPVMSIPPTAAQLDEAELRARRVLNRLQADNGEQIRITRDQRGIVVRGLVETDARSRELDDRLSVLPYVDASIQSIAEMTRQSTSGPAANETEPAVVSTPAGPSPLERWLEAQGRHGGQLNSLSSQLLDNALTAELDSKAIDDLLRRFPSRATMTYLAGAVRDELIMRHEDRMLASLRREQQILASAGIAGRSASSSVARSSDSRAAAADRNLQLTRELILAAGAEARPAESIAADLFADIAQMQAIAMQVDPILARSTP